ncbi:uncharacterized protein LOC129569359 [Sitodiplosis mosellana]|uniref:uncharacterized protein LOC129569359 n=1 Tax=Sitodiplosis mosellana TaxID=263140 RepID=UPI0024439F1B|nr:uncharacterized protein LOC129569359 [Sitodiplosis mosellana]
MDLPKNLQIPHSVEECIYLMRSYIYIDKYTCEVHIREITPSLVPGFILGICAQIPFLYSYVKPYIKDVMRGHVYEVAISDQYKQEMVRNEFVNAQLLYYNYTPADCDYVLSVILNAVVRSTFGHVNANFLSQMEESSQHISQMANIFPMAFYFPQTFRHIMRTTLISTPELRIRMMSLLCQNHFYQKNSVWSLVKRYIWIQVRNFHMGTFMAIGDWYEAREKTLAHVDAEIVDEMKRYEIVMAQMKAIAHEQGYNLGTFRILNPKSDLPYLRQFPNSAYCAIEWKKKINSGWKHYHYDLDRFGIDTQSLDRMMSIPVKFTLKRRLNDEEIETISAKRFKVLETVFTAADDDDDADNQNDEEIENETEAENMPKNENVSQEV